MPQIPSPPAATESSSSTPFAPSLPRLLSLIDSSHTSASMQVQPGMSLNILDRLLVSWLNLELGLIGKEGKTIEEYRHIRFQKEFDRSADRKIRLYRYRYCNSINRTLSLVEKGRY